MTVSRRDKEVDISKKQVVGKEEVEGKFWVSNQQCPWNRLLYLIVTLLFQMKDYSIYNLSIPASYPYIQLQTVSTSTDFLKLFLGTLEGREAQIMLWTAVVFWSELLSSPWLGGAQNPDNTAIQNHSRTEPTLGQLVLCSLEHVPESYYILCRVGTDASNILWSFKWKLLSALYFSVFRTQT